VRRGRDGEFDVVPCVSEVDTPENCRASAGDDGAGYGEAGCGSCAQHVGHRTVDVDVHVLEQTTPGRPTQLVRCQQPASDDGAATEDTTTQLIGDERDRWHPRTVPDRRCSLLGLSTALFGCAPTVVMADLSPRPAHNGGERR
jgi:hypothetical protein